MEKYMIGFANKHYTLWKVNSDTQLIGKYCSQTIFQYRFIQNLGYDLDKIREKYPDLDLDLSLKGHFSFSVTKKTYPENVFPYGKYEGTLIFECQDFGYLKWWFDNETNKIRKDIVLGTLKMFPEFSNYSILNGYIVSMEDLNSYKEQEKLYGEYRMKCDQNESMEFTTERNLDKDGFIWINNVLHIEFQEFKQQYYQGYVYGLPLDSKGKAKRIKNKPIIITDYSYQFEKQYITIQVKSWDLLNNDKFLRN